MELTLVAFASFYAAGRHTARYADTLVQALGGQLVLLHVNHASAYDPYAGVGESFRKAAQDRQVGTAAALEQQAHGLSSHPTVEVATDLLPAVAQDVAMRHHPALFVISQPAPAHPAAAGLVAACAELLRAGNHPLLVVPIPTPAEQVPRRILIAADRELFALIPAAQPLHQLLALPGAAVFVAHVSEVEDDEGCALALRAVQASGLTEGLPTPELRGYEADDYAAGLLAAVQDTQAELVVVVARPRSYLSELFHHSVTARLLQRCPVPVLVLPTEPEAEGLPIESASLTTVGQWTNAVLSGLSPAS
ncbi:MAG: universal stress protein [Hymenobacteraceae bacterium]|nr:universal stress protein [Hymenobacteraceae bacterium]